MEIQGTNISKTVVYTDIKTLYNKKNILKLIKLPIITYVNGQKSIISSFEQLKKYTL